MEKMNERERLIELLNAIQRRGEDYTDYEIYGMRLPDTVSNENVADHLLANGVTVQRWPKEYLGRWGICYPREKEDAPEPPMEEE